MSNIRQSYGLCPEEWEVVKIKNLVEYQQADLQTGPFGTNLLASEYKSHGTPVIAVKNIQSSRLVIDSDTPRVDAETHNRLRRYEVREGDIIFGRKGAVDRCALVDITQDGWLQGSDCIRLRFLTEEISPKFISYVFESPEHIHSISRQASGSTMPSLNQAIIGNILLPLPPLAEQKKIAEILSTWDEAIAIVESLIAALKVRKQGLMQRLLTGEMRFPGFDDAWEEVRLGDVVEILDSQRKPIKSSNRNPGQYPYYGASGIIDYIDDYLFDEDLILLGEDGENILSRSVPLAFQVKGKIWVNNHAHVLRPNRDMDHRFLAEYLESLNYEQFNTGTAQPKINQYVCQSIPIFKPGFNEQTMLGGVIEILQLQIEYLMSYLSRLREQKKGLMQRLLTGEVRVK